jgi:hypothetical protein
MFKTQLAYFSPSNQTVTTETGFMYVDPTPTFKFNEDIEAETEIELFEKFYKKNNQIRYCNGHQYKFVDSEWECKYKEWLNSDDYKSKSFNLYYGGGIVD